MIDIFHPHLYNLKNIKKRYRFAANKYERASSHLLTLRALIGQQNITFLKNSKNPADESRINAILDQKSKKSFTHRKIL